ncbi:MAG: ferritin-like domain-containing protein [Chloroflexota bacterium]|nr:ferritin-like domain-containing protein [Chloroflexota bacterium]
MADTPGKKATANEEIVVLLKEDMKGEHAAIIQYLQHAYKLSEGEIPTEVEGIARDEMRHFRWLGEQVVVLGGNPTMERDPIFLDTPEGFDLMLLDVEAEDRAVEQYEAHLAAIDHPKVRRLLERILVDERTHRLMFKDFVKELGGDPNKKLNPPVGPWNQDGNASAQDLEVNSKGETISANLEAENRNDHPLVKLLNNRVRQEYMTVMTYLHRSFVRWNTNPALSRSLLEDRAIWHMTHLGHVGEAVAGLGERPEMISSPLPMVQAEVSDRDFSQWGKENETQLVEDTLQLLQKLLRADGEELEGLELQLKRVEKHDRFMEQQFEDDLN